MGYSCCLRVDEEGLDGSSVDRTRPWPAGGGAPSGCASACFEPKGSQTDVSWNFVGQGKGDYNAMESYDFVGEGRGNFHPTESEANAKKTELLPAGRRPKPAFYCCVSLICFLTVAGVVHYVVTWLGASRTSEVAEASSSLPLALTTPAPTSKALAATTSTPAPGPTSEAVPGTSKAPAKTAPAKTALPALKGSEAPGSLHILPICSVGYPGLSKWCCQNYKRNCPKGAAPAGTPPPPMTTTMPGCGQVCTIDGTTATCGARVQWSAKNEFAIHAPLKANACSLAHEKVLKDCPGCSLCPLKGAGCKV